MPLGAITIATVVGLLANAAALPPGSAADVGAMAQTMEASKPTHAVRGIVRAIGDSTIAITTGSGRHVHEMTFVLTASTHREGTPAIGSTVSIRYRVDHSVLLATAISVQPEK